MTTATLDRPVRRKQIQRGISAKWRKLFKLIPGYDPIISADSGDWFDEDAAERVINFFPDCLKHAKGEMAGQPFNLEPWQQAVTGCLFGWKREDGTRRYREAFIYVASKNGKSTWVAGMIIYVMLCDDEEGQEIYSAASSAKQSGIIFSHVYGMIRQQPELSRVLRVYGAKGGSVAKSVVYDERFAYYHCLAADADTADGCNPNFNAIDELHRHKKSDLAELLLSKTAARSQPITVYTTTADYNRESLCNNKLRYARTVRDNNGRQDKPGYDPSFLPVIYEASIKDDYTKKSTWQKANPNLGVTVQESFLKSQCQKATEDPSQLNNFLRLHLNIVTDADVVWITKAEWEGASGLLPDETYSDWKNRRLKELAGKRCICGLDISSKEDLTALVQIFPPDTNKDGKYIVIPYFWIPSETAARNERKYSMPYSTWQRLNYIEYTSGNEVDQQAIRKRVNELRKQFKILGFGYDEWNAMELARQLREEDGLRSMFIVRQGSKSLSEPMKSTRAKAVAGGIEHGNHPILADHISHTMAKVDVNDNIQPIKGSRKNKIDGAVALITGMAVAIVTPPPRKSAYANRGVAYA